jgi:hypothetical protein
MNKIFETSHFGSQVIVYPDKLVYKAFLKGIRSIPIEQIASVYLSFGLARVIVETTGGRKYKLTVKFNDRQKLYDAIYQAIHSKSNAD